MSFWTFVFSISATGMLFGFLLRSKELKYRAMTERTDNGRDADPASLQAIEKKLEQMEQRLQALETIVIERERHHEFDNALNS